MRTPPPLPFEFSAGPFSVTEARAAGIPYSRLRRQDLEVPFRGVRAPQAPISAVDRCLAYAPRLRDAQVFSHSSAAALWGMWLPRRLEDDPVVDILALPPAERPRAVGVRGHRGTVPVGLARGLPATAASVTWLQLGAALSVEELVAAGDSLLRRDAPLSSIQDLTALVESSASLRGVRQSRRALPLLRSGVDSARESWLRLLLRRARLPEPEVNGVIELRDGKSTRGDLVLREWKVLVEYDGVQHRVTAQQFERDVRRLEDLGAAGWTVIRVLSVHLGDPQDVVARVVGALRAHGWRGRPSRGQFPPKSS